jgi:anti-sigma B factor antagonist
LQIATRDLGDIAVLELSGRLDGGPETSQLPQILRSLLAKGRKTVVLDLAEVPWANSLGIGALISLYASSKQEGARLVLCSVPERVLQVLKICGVVPGVFDVHDDADAALARLG